MKKITAFLLLIFSFNSYALELKPLLEFLNENDAKDPSIREYLSKRCAASNLAMTRFIGKEQEGYEIAFNNYLTWFLIAGEMRKVKFPEQDEEVAGKNIASSILNMTDEMEKILQNSQDLRGSIFEGNNILTDITLCTQIIESVGK